MLGDQLDLMVAVTFTPTMRRREHTRWGRLVVFVFLGYAEARTDILSLMIRKCLSLRCAKAISSQFLPYCDRFFSSLFSLPTERVGTVYWSAKFSGGCIGDGSSPGFPSVGIT